MMDCPSSRVDCALRARAGRGLPGAQRPGEEAAVASGEACDDDDHDDDNNNKVRRCQRRRRRPQQSLSFRQPCALASLAGAGQQCGSFVTGGRRRLSLCCCEAPT